MRFFSPFQLFKSVKIRLTLWYAVVLTIFLTIFSFVMYSEFSRALYRDADKSLLIEAGSLEESLQDYLEGMFKGIKLAGEGKEASREPFFLEPQIRFRVQEVLTDWEKTSRRVARSTLMIRIMGFDGVVLLSNLKAWEREIIFPDYERDSLFMETGESIQTIHFRHKPIRMYYRLVRYKDNPLFIIQCGISIHELKSTLHRLALIIWFSIPGIVLVACLAGWFLARRSFRPVDHMIRDAKKITAAYLKSRLPRTHTGDELDRLAETLNEMMDRIETSTKAVQEFSSNVSHELKTPLAIIRGEIDLALRRSRSTETLVETLKVIEEEVNELIRLVDDLMLLVRSDARQLRFEKKRVSLKQILEQVIHFFLERAQGKKIRLEGNFNAEGNILGDPVYLKRLFNNLIDNAIKFTQEGGFIAVNLSESAARSAIVLVKDNGIGIDQEVQDKVFSRFYRADQARSQEGAGLGLNIAKAICDGHGGHLSIKSELGKGTEVKVELPLT